MKTITTLILSAILLVSCTKQNPESLPSTENEKIVKQYFDHFNKHDWKKVAEMYTPVADFKDPSLGQGIVKQTRQQIIEKYSGFGELFPDLKAEVVQIYPSENNHIVVEFTTTGTAPDSSKFVLPICTVFTIENGQIAKDFSYYDNVQ